MGAAKIKVKKTNDWGFAVEIEEGGSKTSHQVTLAADFSAKFSLTPEEVVRRSFEYLLDREPKEAILSSFSIPGTISRYFPDFENEIKEN
jgi:hypothetical protein